MVSIVFVTISVLILIPIIYSSPLGLSRRGKSIMVLVPLLIALLGLLVVFVLPLWPVILIEVFVIGLVAYLMTKKSEEIFAIDKDEEKDEVEQNQEEDALYHLNDAYRHIAVSDKGINQYIEEESNAVIDDVIEELVFDQTSMKNGQAETGDVSFEDRQEWTDDELPEIVFENSEPKKKIPAKV